MAVAQVRFEYSLNTVECAGCGIVFGVSADFERRRREDHRNPMGIRRGWFNWPHNFDPTWLQSCDGFEAKSVGEASKGVGA